MVLSLLVFAALQAAQRAPTAQTEMLGVDLPTEFQVGNHGRNQVGEIIEVVELSKPLRQAFLMRRVGDQGPAAPLWAVGSMQQMQIASDVRSDYI